MTIEEFLEPIKKFDIYYKLHNGPEHRILVRWQQQFHGLEWDKSEVEGVGSTTEEAARNALVLVSRELCRFLSEITGITSHIDRQLEKL